MGVSAPADPSLRLPRRPTVLELNTAAWLTRLSGGSGRASLTLAGVPDAALEEIAELPVDAVWLMGVWARSPAGLEIAEGDPSLSAAMREALPDLGEADLIGSGYCVRDYHVDARFGGDGELAALRARLADLGIGLVLDFVPNHVAPDHPWLSERPECFVRGDDGDLARDPAGFAFTAGGVVARGRDPFFPPWPDVVQLNAFSPVLRDAAVETLTRIGGQCDGVRCDMAMLMTTAVFARTWGERAGPAPECEYWVDVITRVRATRPDLVFVAEAYWDMEWELQQQGFDLCYDKTLYDRLVSGSAESVRAHLSADPAYAERLLRFIENHDEPRAAAVFGVGERQRAVAVVMATVPGGRLVHDGQMQGFRTKIPVFLARGPAEPVDVDLRAFYERLLRAVADAQLHHGAWQLCDTAGWPDNDSHRRLVAWTWAHGDRRELVVVNLSPGAAQGRVLLPAGDLGGRTLAMRDRLSGERFERSGDDIAANGLFVDLGPWRVHFLAF